MAISVMYSLTYSSCSKFKSLPYLTLMSAYQKNIITRRTTVTGFISTYPSNNYGKNYYPTAALTYSIRSALLFNLTPATLIISLYLRIISWTIFTICIPLPNYYLCFRYTFLVTPPVISSVIYVSLE
jgi:hypothetical protein